VSFETPTFQFPRLYNVFVYAQDGLRRGPGFLNLEDALRHVGEHSADGLFAIRKPDGHWYRPDGSKSAVFGGKSAQKR
jgi:hypothetical protein